MLHKNTTITIKNEHGDFSVSAPIDNSVDELLDMVVLCAELSGWNRSTIEQAIIEMAGEIGSGDLSSQIGSLPNYSDEVIMNECGISMGRKLNEREI